MRLALILLVLVPSIAAAEPTDPKQATALFEQGRRLIESGRIAEACAAFDASWDAAPAVTTLFNQANCRELNHQPAIAYALFREAEQRTRDGTTDATRRLHTVALERLARLEPQVTAPAPAPTPPVTAASTTIAPIVEPLSSARTERHHSWLVPTLGVAFLGGAVGAELWARSDSAKSKREPDGARKLELADKAGRERYFAVGLAAFGAGAIGVAIWRQVRDGNADTKPVAHARTLSVEPAVTSNQLGFQLSGRY